MTLTEFLLARIAEDEAVVETDSRDRDAFGPARMAAECEAKRRIVESFPDAAQDGEGWNEAGHSALRDLAAVYADHPDYREEWKP